MKGIELFRGNVLNSSKSGVDMYLAQSKHDAVAEWICIILYNLYYYIIYVLHMLRISLEVKTEVIFNAKISLLLNIYCKR